jgi:hypothetical protein
MSYREGAEDKLKDVLHLFSLNNIVACEYEEFNQPLGQLYFVKWLVNLSCISQVQLCIPVCPHLPYISVVLMQHVLD